MSRSETIKEDAAGLRVAVLVSRYHTSITDALEAGARQAFVEAGGRPDLLEVHDCPGAFELVGLASVAITTGRFDAVVCLGCVVKGETSHDAWLNGAVANELAALSARHGIPVSFGLLTVSDLAQATERAGGKKGNKGAESMEAAIAFVRVAERIRRRVQS